MKWKAARVLVIERLAQGGKKVAGRTKSETQQAAVGTTQGRERLASSGQAAHGGVVGETD